MDRVSKHVSNLPGKKDGLVPMWINAKTGNFRPSTLTVGARADSYYEYLIKSWIQVRYLPVVWQSSSFVLHKQAINHVTL